MIEPDKHRPGVVVIVDANGKRLLRSVYALGKPSVAGPNTTYLKQRHGPGLYVLAPLDQVHEVMKQARALRRAQKATWTRGQLPLDFGDSK